MRGMVTLIQINTGSNFIRVLPGAKHYWFIEINQTPVCYDVGSYKYKDERIFNIAAKIAGACTRPSFRLQYMLGFIGNIGANVGLFTQCLITFYFKSIYKFSNDNLLVLSPFLWYLIF